MYKINSNIPDNIFRGYDIRGINDKEISADIFYTLGRAYGTFLHTRRIKEAAIGRDNRLTSEEYSKAFIQGLNDCGIDTIDIGLSLSQITYFSNYEFKTKGGAMITASHNDKNFNGMKLSVGYSDTMVSEEIQQMKQISRKGKFTDGKGSNRKQDIFESYKSDILKHFNLKKKWKIVVDGCNATPGMFYPAIFREAGCEVIEQNCELDSNFPLGTPDPTDVKVLERLAVGVKKYKADIGFSYDADGDRMSVVDESGNVLWMDTIVALFAQDILDFIPKSKIVFNTLCSKQVTDAIKKAGGEPVMWLTGHSFIKAKIKEERAPFGGELSGHIFFVDNFYGHDDGAYASLRLLQYLERKNATVSEEVGKLSKYISSPEVKVGIADDIKVKFIATKVAEDFKKNWPDGEFTSIDGIRVDLPDRMAIIRPSQNGPYAGIKFEGKTQEAYDDMKKAIRKIVYVYDEFDKSYGDNLDALK